MAACPILAALCVGIEEYQHFSKLEGARRDAEGLARCLRDRELPEERLYLLVGKVTKAQLETQIHRFIQRIKSLKANGESGSHLVVVLVAAHGRQPETSELPAILPSDASEHEDSVDLDALLLTPLDSIKHEDQKLKVWLVIDTCRENKGIVTWTGNEQSQLKRLHRRSSTDFHFLLACDRGRFANDTNSLTKALISALDDPWKDVEAVSREAQTCVEALSKGKQRPWRNSRGDFSGILSPEPSEDTLCMPVTFVQGLMYLAGALAAILVIFVFWVLLQSIDMKCTVKFGRNAGCPENSCFCADCDPIRIYFSEHWEDFRWGDFHCGEILGLTMNRCWFTLLANLLWICAVSRLAWRTRRDCSRDREQQLLVVIPCLLGLTSIIPLDTFLPRSWVVFAVSVIYNTINTSLLASSMSTMLRLASVQQKNRCCGAAFHMMSRQFLHTFWPATLLLGFFAMVLMKDRDASVDEFFEQENKFYLLHLVLDLLFSLTAWTLVGGISTKHHIDFRLQMKSVMWQLLVTKAFWSLFRCTYWCLICQDGDVITKKYGQLIFQLERFALLQILQLLRRFAVTYLQRLDVPKARSLVRNLDD